jgi:hypothetical protein
MQESFASRSRASSLRSPSVLEGKVDHERRDMTVPPTPNQSGSLEHLGEDEALNEMQAEEEMEESEEKPIEIVARTPLLPPVLAKEPSIEELQSPLQSPNVDDTPSNPQSPFDSPNPYSCLPSPPLSTRPSVASFHHRAILPSSEIPVIRLADPPDEWAVKLGHANFTIAPEPYLPTAPINQAACRRLRSDWDVARQNFAQHLKRTGDVYNTNSKTYRLTEEKWASIEATWKSYLDQAIASVPVRPPFPQNSSNRLSGEEAKMASKVVTLDVTKCKAKFPKPGKRGIVGPMEQAKPVIHHRPYGKRSFWKFLQGVLPTSVAFGRSQA